MNPSYLFSLSESKRALYRNQPDLAQGLQISEPEEYEHPPFVENAALRLWYNEQPDRYMTHWHNATEMIVALENCYTVTVQNQIFHLQPGDILVVPPGALHSIQGNPKGEGSRFIFLFELTIFNSMYDFRFVRSAFSNAVLINQTTCPDIYEHEITVLMQCAEVYWSDSPIRILQIYSLLLQFFICYTQNLLAGKISPNAQSQLANSDHKTAIQTLLSKIETHFRICTGHTYWDYINQIRLKKASQLLVETNDAICKIALACGFHDVSSFNRSFKKDIGCTPSEYRARNK